MQVEDRIQSSLLAKTSAHSAAVTAVAFGRRSGGNVFVTASSDKMLKVSTKRGDPRSIWETGRLII